MMEEREGRVNWLTLDPINQVQSLLFRFLSEEETYLSSRLLGRFDCFSIQRGFGPPVQRRSS